MSDYKVLALGRKGYLNVPFIIKAEVEQQTLVISDAFDRFDSFISLATNSNKKLFPVAVF